MSAFVASFLNGKMVLPFDANAVKECSKNDKEIYGYAEEETAFVFLTLYGAQSKKALGKMICPKTTFAAEFGKVFNNSKLKAIIFQSGGYPANSELLVETRKQFDSSKIPYVYFDEGEQMVSSIIIASNVSVNVGDRIVKVLIDDDGYVVSELEFTARGYVEREQRDCKPYRKMPIQQIRERILGSNNPVKIICHANSSGENGTKFLTEKVLKNVPASKLIIMEESLDQYESKFVYETVKWMFDKSYTKFQYCPTSFRNYMIRFKYGLKYYPLILCKKDEILPFKKVVTIPKSFLQFSGGYTDNNDVDVIDAGIMITSEKLHALEFSLEIDANNFMIPVVRGKIFNAVSRLPFQLDIQNLTIPIIGLYGELSFMYAKNGDENGYKLLDSWNGKFGKDLYISLDEKKPKFFEEAVKKFKSYSTSVVHDLIKIMSTSPTELSSLQPTLGYTITSDSDHPILLQIDNYDGEQKAQIPSFFMALLLKQHLIELGTILGEKPKQIGFCLFDDFDADAKVRVENGLKESCVLLKELELECIFVEKI